MHKKRSVILIPLILLSCDMLTPTTYAHPTLLPDFAPNQCTPEDEKLMEDILAGDQKESNEQKLRSKSPPQNQAPSQPTKRTAAEEKYIAQVCEQLTRGYYEIALQK